ncbi:MAG: hypothetical protein CME31_21020 [Gimesia sp.]|uniref:Uncharacterized protein n=1 Tax=Gimesia maris TaxID=122 RepID=A0A3D3RER3_9PLAN|nr:hypothetical protein [Gimesia sp.]HCO26582.1 hypothetical protein [Gimesia maris]|tara:strand:- start:153444 stop:153770 length:327 start_codon:yes stop_codon:yes gene_type:complete
MHRESLFLKILHVLVVTITTSLLFRWLNATLMRPDVWMTRNSYVEELQQFSAQIIGALLGLILGYVTWNQVIRKHSAWDERIIALGCLVLLLVLPVAEEVFRRLTHFL